MSSFPFGQPISSPTPQQTLADRYPGGFFLGFNAAIDRKAAEQFVSVCTDAARGGFAELNLCISSTNGVLDHAYYLCSILDALPIKIRTWNVGNIMSAANLVFLCGDVRYATPGSTFYFHQTEYSPPPNQITEAYLVDRTKTLRYDNKRSATIVADKTGQPIEAVRRWQRTS